MSMCMHVHMHMYALHMYVPTQKHTCMYIHKSKVIKTSQSIYENPDMTVLTF